MSKERKFKPSKVIVKDVLAEKAINDKARKLDQDYKVQIEKLKVARDEIIQLGNKYLLKVDIFDAIEKANIITIAKNQAFNDLESHLLSLNDDIYKKTSYKLNDVSLRMVNNSLKALDQEDITLVRQQLTSLKTYTLHGFTSSFCYIVGPLIENIEKLAKDFEAEVVKKNFFEKEAGLTLFEVMALDAIIDNFLNIYSDIIAMDPRSDAEKSKSYHEYFKDIINKIPTNGFTEAASSSIKTDPSALPYFKSAFSFFSNTEDKDFFASMPPVDEIAITRKFLRHELNHFEQEEPTENQALAVINKSSPLENIKLTDVFYTNMLHKNNQAEAQNIVELTKAFCFESVIAMQEFVILNCKSKNHLGDQQKCIEYNHKADLAAKNCDGIFPMETNYDEILHEKLIHSVSESVVISNDGMLYIGAGKEVFTYPHYTPQISSSSTSSQGDLILSGEADILSASNDLVIHNE